LESCRKDEESEGEDEVVELTCFDKAEKRSKRLEEKCHKKDDMSGEKQECLDKAMKTRELLFGKCKCNDEA